MRLRDLASRLGDATLHGGPEVEVASVTYDSRKVQPDSLFVAIRGHATDGNRFIEAAQRKGACAVASELEPPAGSTVPWIQVRNARQALAQLAAALHGDPARSLDLVGITGTNGKTTTAFLSDAALRAGGHTTGLLGTVRYRVGDTVLDAVRTTPESSDIQAMFRDMVTAGCDAAVLEVSSHSLMLERVAGCVFRVAVFTNLTRDHLDFHGDMESYFAAKRILFERHLNREGVAVINADDDRAEALRAVCPGRVLTFGLSAPADFMAEEIRLDLAGTRFRATTPVGAIEITTPLLGRFNVENVLAALATAVVFEVPLESAVVGLRATTVPGRLERIDVGQPFTVLVDYAHTDDALRKLLETVRQLGPKKVITVFGCGGDRDHTKRPLMGAVAARLSERVVVTSDNPRSEPPEAIIEAILRGMNGNRGAEHLAIPDRREAIQTALAMAAPGDVVVVAGKGHETTQTLRDRTIPFDDREVVKELLLGGHKQEGDP